MSLLRTMEIKNSTQFNSAVGVLLSDHCFRSKVYTDEDILNLITEGKLKNYLLSPKNAKRIKSMGMTIVDHESQCESETVSLDFDYQVASYYVQKVQSSKRRGIEFSLTLSQVKKLLQRKTCYYTGVKLNFESGSNHHWTLDRKNNLLGYTKENTVVCSSFINSLKNNLLENDASAMKIDLEMLKKFVSKL